jgi:Tol biopolymer transport system component/predicted Ser/Thr protein kinase
MPLGSGSRIGPYEIVSPLGAGGMGEVYRARDSKLKRDVAIKVLPADVAGDRERLARFQREAEVLASLNHPHIAHVYGIEENALIMELVEGEDLSQRIARGAIPIDEALPIARQIAEALEAAHEAGIVHRDLKPANVKVRPDGTVKVLDFGLAKALEPGSGLRAPGFGQIADSPTITSPAMTMRGVILGTAAYMAPEQAKGKFVDKRADIWAFGCVLFEMLTGTRAFKGDDVTDIITSVMRDTPDWNAVPAPVRGLVKRCLEKDPRRRLRDVGDARIELEAPAQDDAPARVRPARSVTAIVATAISGALLVGFAVGYFALGGASRPADRQVSRFVINLPDGVSLPRGNSAGLALSPDDRVLAFLGTAGDTPQIYLKWLNEPEPKAVPGTDNARDLFFSPDGRWLGFFADRQMKKISLADGTVVTIAPAQDDTGAAWSTTGTIVFAPGYSTGLFRVSANGGDITTVTERKAAASEASHTWPDVLPDGDHVLYTIEYSGKPFEEADIGVVSLATGVTKIVLKGGAFGRYSPSGHLVYARGDRVLAVPFDTGRLEVAGEATTVATGVAGEVGRGRTYFALSRAGSLAIAHGQMQTGETQVAWVGRDGSIAPATKIRKAFNAHDVNAAGDRAIFQVTGSDDDLWMLDLVTDVPTRLTFGTENYSPALAPDGQRFAWTSDRDGAANLYVSSIDNPQSVERLTTSAADQFGAQFSPDGKSLVYMQTDPKTGLDIWRVPLEGSRQPQPLVKTPFEESVPMVSPDGRWLAFASNETGRIELYVQPFPQPGPKRQITGGRGVQLNTELRGAAPQRSIRWSRDGRELFYWDGDWLMSLPMAPGLGNSSGPAKRVFELAGVTDYDAAPDGRRFLVVRAVEPEKLRKIVVALGGALEIGRAP